MTTIFSFFSPSQALQLLNFLIVDSSSDLCEAIGSLDPFPDTMQFKQINRSYKHIRKDRTSVTEVQPSRLQQSGKKHLVIAILVFFFNNAVRCIKVLAMGDLASAVLLTSVLLECLLGHTGA